ncbi:HAMP domain-containing sensor histidine kinase [Actinomadura meridiana]|uniref:histidine kinase n=1 Tax=Actinomadura meridiana TaxID=559626 RepID=A0ABP8CF64_9ACTN
MRGSLLARLLAASVLIAVCSTGATVSLAVRATTGAIRQEHGRALAADNRVYTALLDYAATHRTWSQVGPVVDELAASTGRRVVVRTMNRAPLADSMPGNRVPRDASAVVDPLAVDSSLVPGAADRIAPTALGPFRLTATDRARLDGLARRVLSCVQERTGSGAVVAQFNGHPSVRGAPAQAVAGCGGARLAEPTPGESAALSQLTGAVNRCLGASVVRLDAALNWTPSPSGVPRAAPADDRVRGCLTSARRDQLAPYVAPAALLFITNATGAASSPFDLSTGNRLRIGLTATAVLALTIAVTVLAAARLTRPLRALTGAAQRIAAGDGAAPVTVRGHDKIAQLAAAFNDMSASLARSERLRRDMVSDIAHELRTPLSNIRGWLEATQDGVADTDPALIDSLLDEALQLQHIVDDLQDLALADAGALRLHPEPASLADVLHRRDGVHYELGDVTLTADPVRLRQMVDNLVANALRHTGPDGRVVVTARTEHDQAVIEVSDTGIGIAPDDLPHVFDRFWRAEKSRGRRGGGSGLGLAIVRKLAEAHGGTATATSTVGAGSTFTIRIPTQVSDIRWLPSAPCG